MKSYSTGKGTSLESTSKSSLIDILGLIPDNSNTAISPRDFRDAFFTTWENSTIRLTHSGSGEYIGIDREDVKSKIFLGKKELSGTKIMSSVLLSSDIDVFFYNTKSDSDNHNFKSAFLAGDDPSLWKNSPYIEVVKSDNSLSFRLINDNGSISLKSNLYLDLNGLKIPSSDSLSEMRLNPLIVSDSDLLLSVDSKNYLNFKKPIISENDVRFTDERKTLVEIGGIKLGSSFLNVPVSEIIRQILYPYLPPLVSVEVPSIFLERNHVNDIEILFKYSLTKRSLNIKSTTIKVSNSKTSILTKMGPQLSFDGMSSLDVEDSIVIGADKILSDKENGEFNINISSFDGEHSSSEDISVNFVYPYYSGISSEDISDSKSLNSNISNFEKSIKGRENQEFLISGNGHVYLAYPSEYGELSDITDLNDDSVIKNFDSFTIMNINSPENKWSSKSFIVYRSKDTISVESFPLLYRILFD